MSTPTRTEFGYFPYPFSFDNGKIRVSALPALDEKVNQIERSAGIDRDWIYPGLQPVSDLAGNRRLGPYPARVFGLPKTHELEHQEASYEQVDFLVWMLSFFLGIRLTTTEAGFLDATPIRPGKLVDFSLSYLDTTKALELADNFWMANTGNPQRCKLLVAAIHALYLSQYPKSLEFEKLIYSYTAIDACFALAKSLEGKRGNIIHSERIAWMCNKFGIAVPAWADPTATNGTVIAAIRNATLHEALFLDEPLGFATKPLSKGGLTLEVNALICRLLVALLGAGHADYITTPISTRQYFDLRL